MYKSETNLGYRKGLRTEKKWLSDMGDGTERENQIMAFFVEMHNSLYRDKIDIFDYERINKGKVDKDGVDRGDYRDALDFRLELKKAGSNKTHERIVEVEHLNKRGSFFRFKQDKLIRCRKYRAGILYVHNLSSEYPKMRCFSCAELCKTLDEGDFASDMIYDGKLVHKYSFSDYSDWVDFSTLEPEKEYFDQLRKLVVRKK